MSDITASQYCEYIKTKDLLKSGLEHLMEKEEDENGDATDDKEDTGLPTGLPKDIYYRLTDTLARRITGIPLAA